MVLAYMPVTAAAASGDWSIYSNDEGNRTYVAGDENNIIYVIIEYKDEKKMPALEAMWYKDGQPLSDAWSPVKLTNYAAEAEEDGADEEDIEEDWYTQLPISEDGLYRVEVREVKNPDVMKSLECNAHFEGWTPHAVCDNFDYKGGNVTLEIKIIYAGEEPSLTYKWYRESPETEEYVLLNGNGGRTQVVSQIGQYMCIVSDGHEKKEEYFSVATPDAFQNKLRFEAVDADNCRVHEYWSGSGSYGTCYTAGDITIPDYVTFSDGRKRAVRYFAPFICYALDSIKIPSTVTRIPKMTFCDVPFKSIYIPPSVKTIEPHAVGYALDDNFDTYRIPGFIIYGKKGSEAEKYAARNKITFIDPDVEKVRQGIRDSKLPKLSVKKTVAAKRAVTVKWKKLSAKNRKKVTGIEIWICPNKGFGQTDTIIKTVSKKKASCKISGLKSKQKYFVKIRTIKKSGKKKYVSKWSKPKSIKVK